MIKSMTGFGKGENEADGRRFTVEIKSVNHRYNDINIKLPRFMNSLEDRIRKHLSQKISRGKTDVYINFETFSQQDVSVRLNEELAKVIVEKINHLRDTYSLKSENTLDLVARFPDVLTIENVEENEEIMYNILLPALDSALKQFVDMREREGAALKADILKKCAKLKEITGNISERSAVVPEEYRQKLRSRIDELLGEVPVDEQRLSQEVLVFADRCCIDEEITRLYSHISQLEDILESDGAVGRKLDFLVQELNREANTSASKSGDIAITQSAIELKSEIEKIREQIQNIE
ncbi:YicC family protein [Lachnospiraceae bacterium NSJ-143]|nr:YicC family protein [Lachnospiraceae bacterium NSJ-143]